MDANRGSGETDGDRGRDGDHRTDAEAAADGDPRDATDAAATGDPFSLDDVDGGSRSNRRELSRSDGTPVAADRTNGHHGPREPVRPETRPPAPPDDRGEQSLRGFLGAGESLNLVRDAALHGKYRGQATVGLTDSRLLVVTDAGEFLSVRRDRVCSVRSTPRTTLDVQGMDARVMFAVGYLLAIVGFLAVLGGSVSELTPVLTLVTLGGLVAVDHVRRTDGEAGRAALGYLVRRLDSSNGTRGPDDPDGRGGLRGSGGLGAPTWINTAVETLASTADRLSAHVRTDTVVLYCSSALVVAPFLAIVGVESGLVVPFFALLTVASIGLVVYTFRHRESLDGIDVALRRQRTVTACLDDGRTLTVRTAVDADLDRHLAGGDAATPSRRNEVSNARS